MDNPQEVLEGIKIDRAELIRLSVEYDKSRRALGAVEYAYEEEMAKAIVRFEVNYRKRFGEKSRIPGEDVRKAHAHSTVSKVWAKYLAAKASVESLEKLIRIRQSHLSSLQSELNWMTEELRHSG